MSGGDESQYNDSNRAFVQAVFARGAFTFDEIKPVLAAIFTAYGRFPQNPKHTSCLP